MRLLVWGARLDIRSIDCTSVGDVCGGGCESKTGSI